ncbi:MAG TPA: tripartite tricarboxylate transporter substrate binding protein [Bordetella sp.]|nr:tripartite tricarboxylate transporter substrate binding protein [Bordetella sp.]
MSASLHRRFVSGDFSLQSGIAAAGRLTARARRVLALSSLALAAAAASVMPAAPARAAFPERPITIVVPYPVGGATDTLARTIGQRISETMKQSVVVENRTGGSGLIGMSVVSHAATDGYTILFGCTTDSAIFKAASKTPPSVNLRDDFAAVAGVALAPHILVVPSKSSPQNVAQLIDLLKREPGKHNFASIGIGTLSHLEGELLMLTTGVQITHVPYRGGSQALMDLIAGNSSLMFLSAPAAVPHMKSGAVRVLAVAGDRRLPMLPDVPTITEAGVKNFSAENLFGFYAPKGTPPDVINTLSKAIEAALQRPDLKAFLESQGLEVQYTTPAVFTERTVKNFESFDDIVKKAHVTLD